ncbi:MAG TPA: hypothetical protein VF341_00015, partial [Anaeromyxobacteraceae bacterium]
MTRRRGHHILLPFRHPECARMTLDLTCQACDTSFELDVSDLLDEPRVQCPGCDVRLPRAIAEALSGVLDELLGQVSRLRPKFQVILEVESEDLPPPYDRPEARVVGGE